jgi:hypothetical protein
MKELKMNDEIIIFKHLAKTGGSSLRHSIHYSYDPNKILYNYALPILKRTKFIEECTECKRTYKFDSYWKLIDNEINEDNNIKLLYGHFTPRREFITKRKPRYFTMFRHPYTRLISLYNFCTMLGETDLSFEDWIPRGSNFNASEKIKEFEDYEKILFYEEYQEGLDFLSELLQTELHQRRDNVSNIFIERSDKTDELINRYQLNELKIYDHFRNKS